MGIVFFLIWLSLLLISFHKRKDFCSPSKLFLLNIIVFWGDIFVTEYNIFVNVCFFFTLIFGFLIIKLEGSGNNLNQKGFLIVRNKKILWIKLWILTLIPILSQIMLIDKLGGVDGYMASISLRVKEWQGLGIYLFFLKFMQVINLLYFFLIVKIYGVSKSEKIGFLLNLVIFMSISLLSGSRSTLLVNFILMAIIYYYVVHRFKIKFFLLLGVSLLFIAMLLGAVRNGLSYHDGELITGLSDDSPNKKMETSNFSYGLFPLKVISETNYIESYKYGSTYLSAITNLVPRTIWPDKPDTGGVVFTNEYYNVHNGYSNYSTSFIVEGILNWGEFLGVVMAYLLMIFIYVFFLNYFKSKYVFDNLQTFVMYFMSYACCLYIIPSYFHGEFTTVTHTLFVNKLVIIILVVKFVISSRVKYEIYK